METPAANPLLSQVRFGVVWFFFCADRFASNQVVPSPVSPHSPAMLRTASVISGASPGITSSHPGITATQGTLYYPGITSSHLAALCHNFELAGAWVITEQLRANYKQLFAGAPKANPVFMSGLEARDYLGKSGLDAQSLGKIWSIPIAVESPSVCLTSLSRILSDRNQDGNLDADEFSLAMFLCQAKLAGKPLPDVLPETLVSSYRSLYNTTLFLLIPLTFAEYLLSFRQGVVAPALSSVLGSQSGALVPVAANVHPFLWSSLL